MEGVKEKGNESHHLTKVNNWNRGFLLASAILFTSSLVLQILSRTVSGFGEWYAVSIYPFLVGAGGRLSGIVSFSVVEICAYLLICISLWYIIRHFREGRRLLIRALFLVTGVFFLFTVNCGINYYRKPFSSYTNLQIRKSSKEELMALCISLTEVVNQMCEQGIKADITTTEAGLEGVAAMNNLGDRYPQLSGYYPRPKPLLWSYFFSVQQLCGQYSPFTIEANYNRLMPGYNIPHTVCHELSHLRGFMREDEANFIGYLACIGSENDAFRYSGYLSGWVYATNALAKTDLEAYGEICDLLDQRAWDDLRYNNEYWGKYDGKAAEVSNQLNDTYLKINSQADGVKSYGRAVDLMLAYERQKSGEAADNNIQ